MQCCLPALQAGAGLGAAATSAAGWRARRCVPRAFRSSCNEWGAVAGAIHGDLAVVDPRAALPVQRLRELSAHHFAPFLLLDTRGMQDEHAWRLIAVAAHSLQRAAARRLCTVVVAGTTGPADLERTICRGLGAPVVELCVHLPPDPPATAAAVDAPPGPGACQTAR